MCAAHYAPQNTYGHKLPFNYLCTRATELWSAFICQRVYSVYTIHTLHIIWRVRAHCTVVRTSVAAATAAPLFVITVPRSLCICVHIISTQRLRTRTHLPISCCRNVRCQRTGRFRCKHVAHKCEPPFRMAAMTILVRIINNILCKRQYVIIVQRVINYHCCMIDECFDKIIIWNSNIGTVQIIRFDSTPLFSMCYRSCYYRLCYYLFTLIGSCAVWWYPLRHFE